MMLPSLYFQTLCAAGKILLQFFYLAAFAFLFVEAVHMFVTVHSRHSVSGGFLKYFLIGWGRLSNCAEFIVSLTFSFMWVMWLDAIVALWHSRVFISIELIYSTLYNRGLTSSCMFYFILIFTFYHCIIFMRGCANKRPQFIICFQCTSLAMFQLFDGGLKIIEYRSNNQMIDIMRNDSRHTGRAIP